jgi:TetR/AcrR family transcriptional regulator
MGDFSGQNLTAAAGAVVATGEGGSRTARRGRSSKVTRNMILKAALAEFAEQGYEGSTTASIARRVGVTQPLVHYHFGSKEALWRTTVDGLFERLHTHLTEMGKNSSDLGSAPAVVELTFGFMDFTAANPEFARIVNHEGVVDGPRLRWLTEHYLRPLFERFGGYLDKLKGAGLVRDIPNAFLLFVFFGAAQHFFDLAPLVKEMYGIDARSPEASRAYTNALLEVMLTGATKPGPTS